MVGIVSGSLALISDAGHMAADVVALGAALVATKIATRPDDSGRRTYGSYRAEVFASGFTVLIMLGVSVYVVVEAVRRIGEPVEVSSGPMLVVGALGLVVNLVCLALLRGGAQESINVKGAYLEVMADAAGSVGVIVAGVLVAPHRRRPVRTPWSPSPSGSSSRSARWCSAARSSPSWASTRPRGSTSTRSSATSRRSPAWPRCTTSTPGR